MILSPPDPLAERPAAGVAAIVRNRVHMRRVVPCTSAFADFHKRGRVDLYMVDCGGPPQNRQLLFVARCQQACRGKSSGRTALLSHLQ
eukprot:11594837-Alexandrium_andersonii.AAC.1